MASLATASPRRGGGARHARGSPRRLADARGRASAAQPPGRLRGDTGNLYDTTCHLPEDSPVGDGTLSPLQRQPWLGVRVRVCLHVDAVTLDLSSVAQDARASVTARRHAWGPE